MDDNEIDEKDLPELGGSQLRLKCSEGGCLEIQCPEGHLKH